MNTYTSSTRSPAISGHDRVADTLLELDPAVCADTIGRAEFRLRHHLCQHELLSLEAIAKLVDSLPAASIECLDALQSVVSPGGKPRTLLSRSEAVLNIEANQGWMVIKNVEQNPAYRRLLDEVLDEVTLLLPQREGRMGLRETFLFLSAPESVTPVHIDPEHNLLLHVRGTKQFSVGEFAERATEQREIKRYLEGGHRNLAQIPARSNDYHLQPGDGLYMPPWRPHWVKNGPALAISLSVTFRTRRSERYEYAHMVNSKLQRLGLSPRPPGESEWLDSLKAGYVRGKRWLRRNRRPQRGTRNYS